MGLTLYLEPRYSGVEAELEEKIILGQRFGDWKWALNLTHATEWEDHFQSTEGEVEASFGITRKLSDHWYLGVEARDHNELPEYAKWENTALYLGPVITFQREKWWATLTVMPTVSATVPVSEAVMAAFKLSSIASMLCDGLRDKLNRIATKNTKSHQTSRRYA